MRSAIILIAMMLATLLAFPGNVEAKKYNKNGYKWVKFHSQFDVSKSIVLPIRRARYGTEVRLPGGHWIDCAKNCEWTVQKYHLDRIRYTQIPFGPGYIRFNFTY